MAAKVLYFIPQGTEFLDQYGGVHFLLGTFILIDTKETRFLIKNREYGDEHHYTYSDLLGIFDMVPKKRHPV